MTIYLPKWLLAVFVVALLAASTFVFGRDATGVTAWTGFAYGYARAGGDFEYPYVSLSGTTTNRPVAVRFRVTSWQAPRRADLFWHLTCWRGFDFASRSGNQDNVLLPYTREFVLPLGNPDYCSLDVSAFQTNGGRVVVNLEARYP